MYQTVEQYAEELSNCRISTKTRSKYNNKQAKMLQWLIDNYPFYVDRSSQPAKIKLDEIPASVIGALLASFVVNGKTEKDGTNKPFSLSHLSGYRNALKSLYKDSGLQVPPSVDVQINNCMKGYQNKVAGYRNDGVLSSREGVDAFSCDAYR
jgi:hypothetical protein